MSSSRQCKVLNVAEKNDAARELSKVMSRGRFNRREGFSKFNKIYEFDFSILGKESKMVMTSVSGHLLALDFARAYKGWKSCRPSSLFTAEVRWFCPDNFTPIKRTLEREIRGCQHLILWTDGDREGENIAEEIIQVCTQVKKTLQIHRARFSEITPQSIMRACASLGRLDQNVSDAVRVRQELDLRIGCAFTRFQTLRLKQVFPTVLSEQLISYGPCQFPTLGFVVERYKQVQAFIPESFHKIKVVHETVEGKVEFNWKRVRVFNHTVCLILYQMCLESPTARVTGIHSRQKSKWRPLPLDTVELEKQASRKLRINAKETMRIAEKLYTQGFISYPRTETNMFPESFDLPAIVRDQTVDPNWGGFASQLLVRGVTPRQGTKTDNAHPPIHPTKYTNSLQGNEQRIYEYIVRHFLACCSQHAEGRETSVEIEVAGEGFSAQGLVITARNYLDVFPYDKWSDKTMPVYQENTTFQPSSIEMVEGETSPPSLLQEADLIALMEKHGIGTDATHAEHIETIKNRNYVGVQPDGHFVPGELGMGLVEGYDAMGYELAKPRLRAELENDLKLICDGLKRKEDVLKITIDKYKDVFLKASQEAHKLDEALSKYFGAPQQVTEQDDFILSEVVRKCPVCGTRDMVVKRKRDGGYMLSCLGYPDCRAVQFFPACVSSAKPNPSLCGNCQPPPVHQLELEFKPGSIPPAIPRQLTACTTCDSTLRHDLQFPNIRVTSSNNNTSSSTTSSSGTSSRSPSGRGRGQRGGAISSSQGTPGRGSRGGRGGRGRGAGGRGRGRGGRGHDEDWEGGGGGGDRWGGGGGGGGGGDRWGGGGGGNVSMLVGGRGDTGYGTSTTSISPFIQTTNSSSSSSSQPPHTDNPLVCDCGEPTVLLTVRKEGPNTGRQFHKCQKRDGGCDFFLWADQATSHLPPPPPPSSSTSPAFSSSGYGSMNSYSGPSSSSSSSSSGPGFLSISRRGTGRGRRGGRGGTSNSGGGGGAGAGVVCNCGQDAVQRTVQKEGANKGRQFFTCSKPRESQCGFFEWADDVPASNITTQGSRRGRGGGRGGGGGGGGGGGRRKPPTCSACGQSGHTKRSCSIAKQMNS